MNDNDETNASDGIAILGLTGRFPGAADVEQFWRNLRDGVESVTFFSDDELKAEGVAPALLEDPAFVKAGVVLDDIEMFDAPFFGLTPREAELTDPQQRLFMECAWEALELAGYNPESFGGLIGLYAGLSSNGYLLNNLLTRRDILEAAGALQVSLGNEKDHLATRVSYKLNLKGPSVTVQSACSTSLVAVHMACQSLLDYHCDLALAGGSAVKVPQRHGYQHLEGSILSPDGHLRAFDARARGIVGGSGVGVVVLKRLEDALADGDHIHAVIRGSAINNDGAAKVGYTAPSVDGQAEVIVTAQAVAGVDASTISYVEAHGTATPLGDRVEMAALTQAFRASTEERGFCAVGSVKTNIGHLDAAAGVAGLIKTVLALKNKQLPPSLNFEEPNPEIDFAASPFYVNSRLAEWETRDGAPRRAGVSSFGIGGTNAHVVVEEAPAHARAADAGDRPWQLLTLSARTETALAAAATNLAEHLKRNAESNLADVAHTLRVGRKAFGHRLVTVSRDVKEAADALAALDPKRVFVGAPEDRKARVAFMFAGQGAQHVGMGRELYETEATFARHVDECAELLRPQLGLDVRQLLFAAPEQAEEAARQLEQTRVTQPALFVVEYALSKLWEEWGVRPTAMIGHSIGEYVAACLAGVFTLEEALRLVAVRGRLLQELPGGAMLAVALPEGELRALLGAGLSVAAINAPSECVASGTDAAVEGLERALGERGVSCRRLRVSHAFHSEMVEPAGASFRAELEKVKLREPQIPFVSNVTGKWITAREATDADYWVSQLRQPVRFAEGVEELLRKDGQVLLEVGPGQTLSGLVKRHPGVADAQAVFSSLPHRDARQPEQSHILGTLGRLWLAGAQVDWAGFQSGRSARRVPLPTYPFERQPYWLDATARNPGEGAAAEKEKTADVADWFFVPSWKRSVAPRLAVGKELRGRASNWLVFGGATPLGSRVEKRLAEEGQRVVTVRAGEGYARTGEDEYTIHPARRQDYESLLTDLGAREQTPEVIAHLWGTEPVVDGASESEQVARAQDLGFYSLLFLAQAVGSRNLREPVRLGVVTCDVQEVTGEETLRPEKATVLGPCRVITQEFQNIACQSIDVVAPAPGTPQEAELADLLIAELISELPGRVVAYRGRHRWTQGFEPVRLERETAAAAPLKQGGVYLITGGLSPFGLALAGHLAATRGAKLLLTDREDFPERDEWERWLAGHDEDEAVGVRVRKLLALEEGGAELLVFRAGADESEKMRAAVGAAVARWGPVDGVVHTEEQLGAGVIQLKTPAAAADVLSPKLYGALALDEIFRDAPPDFVVLFSSAIAHLGGVGQADYAGANAFLGALAHARAASGGVRTLCIDWDVWRWDDRQESLMPNVAEIRAPLRRMREKFGIDLGEAVEVFELALASGLPEVVASTQDFRGIVEQQNAYSAAGLLQQLEQLRQAAGAARPRSETLSAYVAPRNEVEQTVADIWQRLFGIEQVGVEDNFFDLGGHSLLAIQLISQLREAFEVELPINSLFEAQTVANVAAVIVESRIEREFGDIEELLDSIENLSPEEVQEYITEETLSSGREDSHE
jgi:acyl transferase domain-containing protein/acyl carrier protein